MIERRPFEALGRIECDWLKARLHFRFGETGCAAHAPLGPLYIWNDDELAPQSGFGMHAHANVEIVTYVRSGAITHEDSFGNAGRIEAGNVQVMSAGKGVLHAERNEEPERTLLFQIWLSPRSRDGEPRWAMRRFDLDARRGRLIVLASGRAADVHAGALAINATARVLGATMLAGETLTYALPDGASAYLVTTTGRVDVNDVRLAVRDGVACISERTLTIRAFDDTTVVMVELVDVY
ncbi:pirin family protein [Paraburkholderia phymatum]|uniref:Pirin domain protein n=1 Tax=Paraburkholderia phymatum (strain DSM 17167 / CIP 108236 / LMG 21445 / STM815) TaxID=391038 RepID=B2JR25_PARP8|nr:pirin family protein [Paraburkholderia phymatum]ACC73716.1 Pirin domain protein [Paraburkholderia phymatum STM815]